MYAIVNISGKQFKVEEGHTLKVPDQSTDVGKKIKFDKILLTDDNGKVNIGNPIIKNISVSATVLENGRDRKIIIFKKKRRKGYKKKNGHRQSFSLIKIDSISKSSSTKKTKPPAKPKADATKKDKEK